MGRRVKKWRKPIAARIAGILIPAAIGAAYLLAGAGVLAQTTAASKGAGSDDGELEEIVVTAQFRAQTAQSTPISITAIDAGMLESRSQTRINDIAQQAPNVTLEPAPQSFGPALQSFIRGIGQADFNFATEPGVGMYVDDVYYSTLTGSIFDMLDLDHVEVLRGPQGTLAGMNSIGGAIKLYSKPADGEGGGYLEATYGRFNRTEFRGSGDFTLVPDQLFVRISGVSRHEDGYVKRLDYACTHPGANVGTAVDSSGCQLGTEGGLSYAAVRAAIRWTPNEQLEVNLSADNTNDNSEAGPTTLLYVGQANGTTGTSTATYPRFSSAPVGGIPLGTATGSQFISYSPFGPYAQDSKNNSPYINYSTYCDSKPPDGTAPYCIPSVREVSGYGFSGTVDYKVNQDFALKSITAFRYYSATWSFDEDASPLSDETLFNVAWHKQLSEELRLSGKAFADVLKYTLGGFYFDQSSYYGGRINLGSFAFIENDHIPAKNKAAFANVDWLITSKLELNAGVRYTKEDKTFEYGRLGVPGNTYPGGVAPQVASLNGVVGNYDGSKTDYRAALQYQWTESFMTYADVSTGFKGGGINPRPFYPAQVESFGPETLVAYEIGVKSDWLEHRLRVNAATFYDDYKQIQLITNYCAFAGAAFALPCAAPINAGTARIDGGELEIEARPMQHLSVDASLSYLDFKYRTLSAFAVGSGISLGMTTPFAPTSKFSVGAQYEIGLGAYGGLTPRVDLSHQSSFYSNAINSAYNRDEGYSLLNGRLTWRDNDGHWSTALEVKNLTDKLYYYAVFDNRGAAQTVLGEPAPPREWALSIKRSF